MIGLIHLKGPLQAYGDTSKHFTKGEVRNTYQIPTYSGVLGLIKCCCGLTNEQSIELNILKIISKQTINTLNDFHMMGAGYDVENEYDRQNGRRKSDGKVGVGFESNGKTVGSISRREYLEDTEFYIVLECDESVFQAIKNPKWFPFLGRSSCIPSERIYVNHGKNESEYTNYVKELFKSGYQYTYNKPDSKYVTMEIYDVPVRKFTNSKRNIYKSIL